jgi:RNA polymerase sigma-70 factor (ECF subfamily)
MTDAPADWIRVVDRLLTGDRLAFLQLNRLLTRFLTQLRAYDFRDEWEDLRQEVIVSVVANARAGRLRDPHKCVAYIRAITRNKFIDRLNRGKVRHEKQSVPWDDETAKSCSRPVAAAAESEQTMEIWSAVAGLPVQHQQVVEGVYRQGKTYQEVADDTGIPLGTVKRRLREGLDVLRQRLRDVDSNE